MFGIGIDAVDIDRFRAVLARRPGLESRLFTDDERSHLSERADAVPSLAARFAVREATMKALGVGIGAFDFHDVSVDIHATGAPTLKVQGRAAALAAQAGVSAWHVSMSHTDSVAMAVVAAL